MNTVRPRVQKNNCHTAITQALSLNISLPLVKKYWYQNFGRLIFIRYWSNAYCEANMVISTDDFYIGGILNSSVHQSWVDAQKSSMRNDPRYTNTTCFETFPFPLNIKEKEKGNIRKIMTDLEEYRISYCLKKQMSLTELYNKFYKEPSSQLFKKHKKLDEAVVKLYNWKYIEDTSYNEQLLKLNFEISEAILLSNGYSISIEKNPLVVNGTDKKYYKKFGKVQFSNEPQKITYDNLSDENKNRIDFILKQIGIENM